MAGVQVTPELRGAWVGARARTERITPAMLIIALSALGLGLRVYCLLRPGYLLGVTEYDDGLLLRQRPAPGPGPAARTGTSCSCSRRASRC